MVAIFSGRDVGLAFGSGRIIGSAGLLGSAALGRAGEQVLVNAATGNLVIHQQDEFLVGRGPDLAIERIYNGLGAPSDDNGDKWRLNTDRYVEWEQGLANAVRRVAGDGSSVTYLWDAASAAYIAGDPMGGFDTLVLRNGEWLWTDGETQVTERYGAYGNRWRLVAQSDTDGNSLTFTYDGAQLVRVTTADGGWVQYGWDGVNLVELVTGFENEDQGPTSLTRVRYRYDTANRLSQVIVDLSPEDGSIEDGQVYITTYNYRYKSQLIDSITQPDGSRVEFDYDAMGRVTRVTQVISGEARSTTLAYSADAALNGYTAITDPLGQVTRMEYEGAWLTRIVAPPLRPGGASQVTRFFYNGVNWWTMLLGGIVDPLGNTVSYAYDALGHRQATTLIPSYRTVTRSFGARNEILTEWENLAGGGQDPVIRATRYVYDAELHLRYRIDAEGGVTEYRYDDYGQRTDTIEYPEQRFDISGLARDAAPSEAQMNAWRAGIADLSSVRITSNRYDVRGNLIATISYAAATSAGVPLASSADIRTVYAYDAAGRLLMRARSGERAETYAYDGLGRTVMSNSGDGDISRVTFLDAQGRRVVTQDGGMVRTMTYDAAGNLLFSTEEDVIEGRYRTVAYRYDRLGRLRTTIDEDGGKQHWLYDSAGHVIAEISALGEMTEYRYDNAGRLIVTIRYDGRVGAAALAALDDPLAAIDPAQIRPATGIDDLWSLRVYNESGLGAAIDGSGGVTIYGYDRAGQIVDSQRYAAAVSQANLDSWKATPPTFQQVVLALGATYASVRTFYDRAGRQIGTLDGEGYLTTIRYDAAGRKIEEIAYATAAAASLRGAASLDEIRGSIQDSAGNQRTRYAYDGLGQLRYVIDAGDRVTGYRYDSAGRQTARIEYGAIAFMPSGFGEIEAVLPRLGAPGWSGVRVTWSIYDASGQLAYSIDPEGAVTGYKHDAFGRVVRTTAYAIRYAADALPHPGVIGEWAETQQGNPQNRVARSYYNVRGELIYAVDGEGYVTGNSYDFRGNLTLVRRWPARISASDETVAAGVWAQLGASATALTYAYDARGRLVDSWDGEGARRHLEYNPDGSVRAEIVAYGTSDEVQTRFDYDGAGRLIARIDAYGTADQATTRYGLDGFGNILSVTDPKGGVTTRTYDKRNLLLSETNALGGVSRYEYDGFGDAVRITDPLGNVTEKSYDALGNVVRVRDAENYVTENRYSMFGDLIEVIRRAARGGAPGANDAVTRMTYDRRGALLTLTDAEGRLESIGRNVFGEEISRFDGVTWLDFTGYDRRGLVAWKTRMIPSQDSNGVQVASSVVTRFTYDAYGNRTRMVEGEYLPEQRTTNYVYDRNNRLIETRGDAVLVVSQSDHMSTTLEVPTRRFRYDARGNLIETIEANGGRVFSYYDKRNRKIVELNAEGVYSAWSYDANGNLAESRVYENQFLQAFTYPGGPPAPRPSAPPAAPDGLVRQTFFGYDQLNRLVTTRIAGVRVGAWNGSGYDTGINDIVTTNVYDAGGNLIRTADGNGKSSWSYFDRLGRKVAEVDRSLYLTSWVLDAEGNVLAERRYATVLTVTPGATPPAIATTVDDRETVFTYDRVGRRLSETRRNVVAWTVGASGALGQAPTDSTVRYLYDVLGRLIRKTEATGDAVTYTYDVAGRLIQETRSTYAGTDGAVAASHSPTVRYYYNGFGDLTLTRQGNITLAANDRLTKYSYGTAGRLLSMTDAANGTTNYTYDLSGNVVTQTYVRVKSDGTQASEGILYRYDLLGRVTQRTVGVWTGSAWVRTDAQDTIYNAFGQIIATGVNGGAQVLFAYDAAGRLWRTNQGDGVWRYYVYDRAGNQTLVIESEGADLAGKTLDQVLAMATRNGTYQVGATLVDGINATIRSYSGRGELLYALMPRRELDMAGTLADQQDGRTYNAFGELVYQSVNGRETYYGYSTMGRSLWISQAQVQVQGENGALTNVRPTETYYYDLSGRLVGVRDANGGVNTRLLLAGSGYGGTDPLVTAEFHPDGGVVRYDYDQFGDLRRTTDEISRVSTMTYDGMGRLIASVRGYETDYYSYDMLGRRLRHWTGALGATVFDATDYDAQGRVVRTIAMGGDTTTISYEWRSTMATPGTETVGGWVSTTTYANGRTLVEHTDFFGHDVYRKDLGGHVYTFTYDRAGRIVTSAPAGSDAFTYTYLNTGWVGRIVTTGQSGGTPVTDRSTTYGYDLWGNLTLEQYSENSRYQTNLRKDYRNATATYDILGRLTQIVEAGTAVAASTTSYWYDAVGNVRHVRALHYTLDAQGNRSSAATTDDRWYRYDSMNRVVTSQGALVSGQIVRSTTGIDMLYDAAGQRVQATRWVTNADQAERYEYDALGNLKTVKIKLGTAAERLAALYQYDGLGRLTRQTDYSGNGTGVVYDRLLEYNPKGQLYRETVSGLQGSDTYTTVNTYDFGTGGNYALGAVVAIDATNTRNGAAQPTSRTENDFVWYGGAVQSATRYRADITKATVFTSTYYSNAWGQLTSVGIADGRPRTVTFVNDMAGQVIRRDEADNNGSQGDPHEIWYRFGGEQHGYLGNNGTFETSYQVSITNRTAAIGTGPFRLGSTTSVSQVDFDQSYSPITSYTQGGAGGSYTVQSGDTLQSIAAQLWGDASLWFRLAEANGMTASGALIEGQQLVIPSGVLRNSNTASTFNPYDPLEALGDTSPTTPQPAAKPKKKKCGGVLGTIIMVVIAGVVTFVTKGATATFFANALGATAGAATAGAVGAAAGSIASQGFGLATGLQDRFSWKGVALAAIGGGVSGGLQAEFAQRGLDGAMRGSEFLGNVVRGAAINGVTQGVGIVTGLQDKFDWAGFGAASIGSALTAEIKGRIPDGPSDSWFKRLPGDVQEVGKSMAQGIGEAAARSLLTGTSFGDNLLRTLPQVIGETLGERINKYIDSKGVIPSVEDIRVSSADAGSPPALGGVIDILGKINALPITIVGSAIGLLNMGMGLLAGNDVKLRFEDNSIQFIGGGIGQARDGRLIFGGSGAVTLGNVQLYAGSIEPGTDDTGYSGSKYRDFNRINVIRTGDHEQSHTYQYQNLGLAFLPLYLLNGFQSGANSFEAAADRGGRGGSPYPDYVLPWHAR